MSKITNFLKILLPKKKEKSFVSKEDYDAIYSENLSLIAAYGLLKGRCGLIRAWVKDGIMPKAEILAYFKPSWMPKHAPPLRYYGHDAVLNERFKQIQKYSVKHDLELYDKNMLLQAAADLLFEINSNSKAIQFNYNAHMYACTTLPFGWDLEYWKELLNKSQEQRIAIAGAWMCAELDIRQYETTKEPVI